jgi:hypothetical protein
MSQFECVWLAVGWVLGFGGGLFVGARIEEYVIAKVWGKDWRSKILRGENLENDAN